MAIGPFAPSSMTTAGLVGAHDNIRRAPFSPV
jgi:hypothetical protein